MLYVPEHVAKSTANTVCAQLREWGEHPSGVSVIDEGAKIVFGFEVITEEPKWRKTVEVATAHCTPSSVQDQLNAWREKVRMDLNCGKPSRVVQGAIERFGSASVDKALEHRNRG